jgi:TAT (twin-arginine translocation) pathway signal sequence
MDRRDFIKIGAASAAGLVLGAAVPWIVSKTVTAPRKITQSAGVPWGGFQRDETAPWKFGVMADTQWGRNLDGRNPRPRGRSSTTTATSR